MTNTNRIFVAVTLALYVAGLGEPVLAATPSYRVVAYLDHYPNPGLGIIEGAPGVFYSQATATTIFSATTSGVLTYLATFPDPPYTVESAPMSAANGLFYSSFENPEPGSANVFSVGSSAGAEKTYPAQSVSPSFTQNLPDGTLFGIGYIFSASNAGWGLIRVSLGNDTTLVYRFPPGDRPWAAFRGADGNYYGTANDVASTGYVFRVTPAGVLTKLYIPTRPILATLIEASDGNFYGSTQEVGSTTPGTIYKLTPGGQYTYTVLHTFPPGLAGYVDGLIEGSDGKLYGSVAGNIGQSKLFSITKSGRYTTLYTMTNATVDGQCGCTLVQGSDGIFYGTAVTGGVTASGLVFALDVGLAKPKPQAQDFHPSSGAVGAKVLIWGQNLLSASVQFNGVAAAAYNSGANYVWATVPTGAATGPITITTPGGSVTTKASFTVQ